MFPDFFKTMLEKQYGKEVSLDISNGYTKQRPLTLRVNTIKATIQEIDENLKKENIEYKKVKWNESAYIIQNVSFAEIKELEIYKTGKIYLQSLSSMIPAVLLEPKEKENILDMAAAPGRENNANSSNFK